MTQAWLKVPDMTPEQWLDWRREGIGGSDAPAIMGVSPWATAYEKWEEKVWGKRQADNSSKRFGRDTEEASRREFEDLMGLRMVPVNVQNTKESWLRASLDGLDLNGDKVVEIKKANKEDHAIALTDRVPEKYYPQCQHILKVTGKDGMFYFSSPADGSSGKIVEVARDSQYIDQLLTPKEKEFWEQVTTNKAPVLTDRDYLNMENNKKWIETSQKWKETTNSLRAMENQEKLLRGELVALSKNHNAKGNNLSLSKSVVQGRIDYVKAFEDYVANMRLQYPDIDFQPIVLDPYRKESFLKWTLRAID
jgi:putative phage-type endonuclease